MILGYTISGKSSNDAMFFNGEESKDVLCSICGSCLDYRFSPMSIEVKPSKMYDVSYTHDLRTLFSEKFVDFCKEVLKVDEEFKPISVGGQSLYYMVPNQILEFDFERRKVRFEHKCPLCNGYETVAGAYPVFLKVKEPIKSGFFKTDLAFASGKSKVPLIIVGTEWKALIASQKFRGIDFSEISD